MYPFVFRHFVLLFFERKNKKLITISTRLLSLETFFHNTDYRWNRWIILGKKNNAKKHIIHRYRNFPDVDKSYAKRRLTRIRKRIINKKRRKKNWNFSYVSSSQYDNDWWIFQWNIINRLNMNFRFVLSNKLCQKKNNKADCSFSFTI